VNLWVSCRFDDGVGGRQDDFFRLYELTMNRPFRPIFDLNLITELWQGFFFREVKLFLHRVLGSIIL